MCWLLGLSKAASATFFFGGLQQKWFHTPREEIKKVIPELLVTVQAKVDVSRGHFSFGVENIPISLCIHQDQRLKQSKARMKNFGQPHHCIFTQVYSKQRLFGTYLSSTLSLRAQPISIMLQGHWCIAVTSFTFRCQLLRLDQRCFHAEYQL